MRRSLAVAGVVVLAASTSCRSSVSDGTVRVVSIDDPFAGPPAATRLEIAAVDTSGNKTMLAKNAAPSQATVDLGQLSPDAVDSFQITAFDDLGEVVARGSSLPIQMSGLSGTTLGVFVQRTGALARMPGLLTDGREAPLAGVLGQRYVLVGGGSSGALAGEAQLYDLIAWAPLASPPLLPRAPLSLAIAGLEALCIDATGASWLDLTSSVTSEATVPSGGAWAEVAGGQTVVARDGTAYVVGGTRAAGSPSAVVLRVTPQGDLRFVTLTAPRLGAAAAWVEGRGLVIAGGSATAPGVELLSSGATSAVALPYAPDPTTGAGMDALDASHVVLGGGAPAIATRLVDLACTPPSCAASAWDGSMPATLLPRAQTFALDPLTALIVGDDASGVTHAFHVGWTLSEEIPFKVTRNHARALRLPTGAIAIVGGDPQIESYMP